MGIRDLAVLGTALLMATSVQQTASASEPCAHCCEPAWSVTADYLHWWIGGGPSPALLTSSPTGTDRAQAGVLGQPSTSTLFGGSAAEASNGSGLRIGTSRRVGAYTSLFGEFYWAGLSNDFAASSDGAPGLMRPFFNTNPAELAEDAELIAFDDPTLGDVVDGSAAIDLDHDIYSASISYRVDLAGRPGNGLTALIGYRFFRFDESLNVATQSIVRSTGGSIAQGTMFDVNDTLATSNEFHGLELGLIAEETKGPWGVRISGKLAMGGNRRESLIAGSTTTTVPTFAPFVETGGLFAQSSNIGERQDDRFALLPELRIDVRRRIGRRTEIHVGYTLLYLTDALRSGSLIDRQIDGRLLDPGPPPAGVTGPMFQSPGSTVWLQGINLGLTRTY